MSIHLWFGCKRGVQCIPIYGVKGCFRPAQPPSFIAFSILVSNSQWGGVKGFRIHPSKHEPHILSQIAGLFDAAYKNSRTLCREDLLWDTSVCWDQATRDSCFGEGVTDTIQLLK